MKYPICEVRVDNRQISIYPKKWTERRKAMIKTRKMIVMTVLVAAILMASSAAIAASGNWYRCSMDQAGIDTETGIAFVRLTMLESLSGGPTWTGSRWFISSAEAKSVMAVALTAQSSSYDVTVSIPSIVQWSEITGIFCKVK